MTNTDFERELQHFGTPVPNYDEHSAVTADTEVGDSTPYYESPRYTALTLAINSLSASGEYDHERLVARAKAIEAYLKGE